MNGFCVRRHLPPRLKPTPPSVMAARSTGSVRGSDQRWSPSTAKSNCLSVTFTVSLKRIKSTRKNWPSDRRVFLTCRDNMGSLPPMRLSLTVSIQSKSHPLCNEYRCNVSKKVKTSRHSIAREETSPCHTAISTLADPQSS